MKITRTVYMIILSDIILQCDVFQDEVNFLLVKIMKNISPLNCRLFIYFLPPLI